MENRQTVIGSYQKEEDAQHAIKGLLGEGYKQDQLIIFTSKEKSKELDNPENIDVANPEVNQTDEDDREDKNFWQSLKDAFKVRDDDYYEDPNYVEEDDLLHSYRDDLRQGNIVIVVDNYNNESDDAAQSDPSELNTLGTTAGFPQEGGAVHGMGDGGQPPMEPKSGDGTPPDLEDTQGQADPSEITEDRKKNVRKEHLDSDNSN